MSRRKAGKSKDPFLCPSCGTRVTDPEKTWTLVSPFPDKYGRITVTVMGSFRCPNCGHSWRAVVKKLKTGGEEEAGRRVAGEGGGEEEERRPYVIEIDLDELDDVEPLK